MTRRLVLSYLGLALLILVVLEIPLAVLAGRHEHDLTASQVEREASGLAAVTSEDVENGRIADLTAILARYHARTGEEIVVIGPAGQVVALGRRQRQRRHRRETRPGASGPVGAVGHLFSPRRGPAVGGRGRAASAPTADRRGPSCWAWPPRRPSGASTTSGWPWPGWRPGCWCSPSWSGCSWPVRCPCRWPAGGGGHPARAGQPGGPGPTRRRPPGDAVAGPLSSITWPAASASWSTPRAASWPTPPTSCARRSPPCGSAWKTWKPAPTGPSADDMAAAGREVQRLSRVVDGLLTLSRAEGIEPPRPRPVDVDEVIEDRCEAWSALADERHVASGRAASVAGRSRPALLVPGDLDQILDNLLANAVDASPEGGRIRVELVGTRARVAGAARHRRGTRHERGRPPAGVRPVLAGTGQPGGNSGLGLAIVRQLAVRNDASVELRPAEPTGLVAVLRLAAAHRSDDREPTRPSRAARVGHS